MWALGVTMLYVLGRLTLPEKGRSRGWLIHNLGEKDGEDSKRMGGLDRKGPRGRTRVEP